MLLLSHRRCNLWLLRLTVCGFITVLLIIFRFKSREILLLSLDLLCQKGIPINIEDSDTWPQQQNHDNPIVKSSLKQSEISSAFLYEYDNSSNKSETIHNPYIQPLLKCPIQPNPHTGHIRLTTTIITNISLIHPNHESYDPNLRYFNPTIIPLPSWSPHPYLLISRLVTTGLHQESHICLADYCVSQSSKQQDRSSSSSRPRHRRPPPGSKPCSNETESLLGPRGGLYCATPPSRLNIPPTPALRCEGIWAAFPDIPGFHDPRVFWSGSGEPLVIVNSGSQYGCIGLWVVDLRVLVTEVRGLMGGGGKEGNNEWEPKIRYERLTEITRVPRWERSAVEKNWVLFFPIGEEVWVQYDMVGHGVGRKERDDVDVWSGGEREGERQESGEADDQIQIMDEDTSALLQQHKSVAASISKFELGYYLNNTSASAEPMQDSRSAFHGKLINDTVVRRSYNSSSFSTAFHNKENEIDHIKRDFFPPRTNNQDPPPIHNPKTLIPSRSFAKLIGSGYTTPNLTSPFESACLDSSHIHDSLGNTGHWHQGSNALRLVLCHRITASSSSSSQSEYSDTADCELTDDNEDELVREGRVVHVMVMHRKLSNEMKLPMRYERYFIVWEARWPFRVLGISRFPVLFAGERARPWSVEENWPDDNEVDVNVGDEKKMIVEEERKRWENVYFTYTPSLAWAWRAKVFEDVRGVRGLGTGYLNDEVLVGVGMDDVAQGMVRIKIEELLQCLRLCPDFDNGDEKETGSS